MKQGGDWESRYAGCACLFGNDPSPLLTAYRQLLQAGMEALAIGDGEGRNGVWLAAQGLRVLSLDISATALRRAAARAQQQGLAIDTLCCDALQWEWPCQTFDVVTLIFVHLPPPQRHHLHRLMQQALRPGGLIFIEAYHQDQLQCASGGPSNPEVLYTLDILRQDFAGLEILTLEKTTTRVMMEGSDRGSGAVVQLVARS